MRWDTACCLVKSRDLFQYAACRHQTSPNRRDNFRLDQASSVSLVPGDLPRDPERNRGISSIELGRRLGVTQTTAWKIKHKLKQVMLERDASKPLTGRVEAR